MRTTQDGFECLRKAGRMRLLDTGLEKICRLKEESTRSARTKTGHQVEGCRDLVSELTQQDISEDKPELAFCFSAPFDMAASPS